MAHENDISPAVGRYGVLIRVINPRLAAASLGAILALAAGVSLGAYLKFEAGDIRVAPGPHLRVRAGQ